MIKNSYLRDFGLLHANTKPLIQRLQLLLRVTPTPQLPHFLQYFVQCFAGYVFYITAWPTQPFTWPFQLACIDVIGLRMAIMANPGPPWPGSHHR